MAAVKCHSEEVSRLCVSLALFSVFSPFRSKAILACYEQVVIKFGSFYKLEELLVWFYFCLSIDQPPPGYCVISVEQLYGKLGIHIPILNRSITEEAKDMYVQLMFPRLMDFSFFFSLWYRGHCTAYAWVPAGQQFIRKSCNCFQNKVLIRSWHIAPVCAFNMALCGNRICFWGDDDPGHKRKLGGRCFDQSLCCTKKGNKHTTDEYSKSRIKN